MHRKIDPMMIGITWNYWFTYVYPKWNIWPGKSQMSPFFQTISLHLSQVKLPVKETARLCGFCARQKQSENSPGTQFSSRIAFGNETNLDSEFLVPTKKGHIEKFKDKNYKNVNFLQKLLTKDLTIKHIDTFPTLPTLRAATNSKSELETSTFTPNLFVQKRRETFHLLFKMKVLRIDNFWVRKTKPLWKRALQIEPFFPNTGVETAGF